MSKNDLSALTANKNMNRFSWRRVGMVGDYYWPRLRLQVLLYPLASLVVFFLIMATRHDADMALEARSSLTNLLTYAVMFAPVVLAMRPGCYMTDTMLPARGAEKSVYLLFYFLIVVPVLGFVPVDVLSLVFFGHTVMFNFTDLSMVTDYIGDDGVWMVRMFNIVCLYVAITTCLWAVVTSRRNGVVKGVLIPLIPAFVVSFVMAGYIVAQLTGIAGANSVTLHSGDVMVMTDKVIDSMMRSMSVFIPILIAYVVVAIIGISRAISRRTA